MGMFDDIKVEQSLPGPVGEELADTLFQTKSLEQMMDRFVIRDNRLFLQTPIVRRTGEFYTTFFGDQAEVTDQMGYRDYLVSQVHGDIVFYDGQHYFLARFTEGKLTKLEYLGDRDSSDYLYRGGCGIIRPDVPRRVYEDKHE